MVEWKIAMLLGFVAFSVVFGTAQELVYVSVCISCSFSQGDYDI